MYCKMCGNLLDDTDRFCKICGAKTDFKIPAKSAEPIAVKEEVVFNPPFEGEEPQQNRFYFIEEEASREPEKQEAELEEFISDQEMKMNSQREAYAEETDIKKNNEFKWNVHEFPTVKKTEEAVFNWKLDEFGQTEQKKEAAAAFEEELFQEIRDDINRIKDSNIDRFFTFSKKNEEFQKLLDREYEKLNRQIGPIMDRMAEEESTDAATDEEEVSSKEAADEEESSSKEVTAEEEPSSEEATDDEPSINGVTAEEESSVKQAAVEEKAAVGSEEVIEPEANVEATDDKKIIEAESHLSEMAQARAQFFGDELIKDNETIIKKLETVEPEDVQIPEHEPESDIETDIEIQPETHSEPEKQTVQKSEPLAEDREQGVLDQQRDDEFAENSNKPHRIGQIILIIIAVILAAEITILGIRYLLPESAAAKMIDKTQTQVIKTVTGWMDGINELISGKDSNKETLPDERDMQQEEETDTIKPEAGENNVPAPDPAPMADKSALVTSQLGNNVNIQQIKANETLIYQEGKDYGLADLNNSKPISNNIWLTKEDGTTVYYDQSVVGTIIAFDSQWIDYVNGNGDSVLSLLKKDSAAYKKAISFSKIGKVKEVFKTLEIGEIRQGSGGFYVWVYEEIQITEKGATTDKKYNWIYYLEPVDGKMNIVNYFNLNN